ncbi:hypothetical protein F4555_001952 [Mobiluncus mulieris]|uniref:Uncharacterized protein n=1 Tax=Mobiluncus mulieris TaxID=2052 RepID=A0A8G2HT02_9ACTO|nr:hypothetical protein [Mobiluncus mulieris]STO16388.1 Uncharacterised protein [Mobiluncus mulieris]
MPPEDTHGKHAIEAHLTQRGEEHLPVHFALAEFVVLVDTRVNTRWIDYITISVICHVIVRIGDVYFEQFLALW